MTKRFGPGQEDNALVEVQVLRALHGTKVAPALRAVRAHPHGCDLELARVTGLPWPPRPAAKLVVALAEALAALHSTPAPTAVARRSRRRPARTAQGITREAAWRLDDFARAPGIDESHRLAARSWRAAILRGLLPVAREAERELSCAPRGLCHGDLKPANLVVCGARVVLLDFELAQLADPAWDLAVAAVGLSMTAAHEDLLLRAYEPARGWRGPFASRYSAYRLAELVYWPVLSVTEGARLRALGRRPPGPTRRLHLERARTALSLLVGEDLAPLW